MNLFRATVALLVSLNLQPLRVTGKSGGNVTVGIHDSCCLGEEAVIVDSRVY